MCSLRYGRMLLDPVGVHDVPDTLYAKTKDYRCVDYTNGKHKPGFCNANLRLQDDCCTPHA